MGKMLPYDSIKRKIVCKRNVEEAESVNYSLSTEELKEKELEILYNGVVNIDKPSGPTSHDVVCQVKKILNIKKAGHSGTLDPGVTGVLPVALNNGTKVMRYLLTAGKEYVCFMKIHRDVQEKEIKNTFQKFKGKIKQLPPVKSAVKRAIRSREIYDLEILEIEGRNILFKVSCQAGTYIRKLVHDLGKEGGFGANMQELRRVRVGPFDESTLFNLQELVDACQEYEKGNKTKLKSIIFPIERAVQHLPKVWVTDGARDTIQKGAKLAIPGITKLNTLINRGDIVAIMDSKNKLIAIGEAQMSTEEILKEEKGIAFSLKRVM